MKRLVFQRIAAARGSVLLILQHLRFPERRRWYGSNLCKRRCWTCWCRTGSCCRAADSHWVGRRWCKCRIEEMGRDGILSSCCSTCFMLFPGRNGRGFPHSLIGSFFVGIISKFICISTCTMWWLYFAMFLCRMNWFRVWDAFGSLSWRFDMDWLVRLVLKLLCFTVQPLKDLDQESQQVREEEKFQKRLNAWDIWLDSCCDRSGESMWIHDSLSSSM